MTCAILIMTLNLQLDEACSKTSQRPSIGGFTWALVVRMWSRFPVGRPERVTPGPWEFVLPPFEQWDDDEDLSRHPTFAYFWDKTRIFGGKSKTLYKSFINEFDALCWNQVCMLF